MPEQRIVITIDENGQITAKTEGFKGDVCLSELDTLLQDETPLKVDKTDEFYQQNTVSNSHKEQQKNIQK